MIDVVELDAVAVEPFVPAIEADGMKPDLHDGIWLGAREDGTVVGVARVFARDGKFMLEDVWVTPERRSRGAGIALVRAAQSRFTHLWLICDEDMLEYYAYQGFIPASDELPAALADVSRTKGYWQPDDHVHVAMLWDRFSSNQAVSDEELEALTREANGDV
ncbi:MAG TPA: GNAT family N-acetyltransferase [Actinomycetota bacterium]|nr:GNAT family N-acetyltransferase [Actinomycetota bacterium]